MVVDELGRWKRYAKLGKLLAKGLEALASGELARREPGRYELEGPKLYAIVQDYRTKSPADGRWEAHRKYVDIQFVARGVELLGRSDLATLVESTPYDPEKDIAFYTGSGFHARLGAGSFAILWPEDAHMPQISLGEGGEVRKVVVKVGYPSP